MMKLATLIALSLICAGSPCAAQHMNMMDMGPPTQAIAAPVSVPIGFTAGLPTIEVMINGKGPFHLGFDTGAMGGVHLNAATVERIGLTPAGEALAGDPTGKNLRRISLYPPVTVALGGQSFVVSASSAPAMATNKLAALDGIVGLELFGGALVTIDYKAGRLGAEAAALPAADGKTVFSYQGPLPQVPLRVENQIIEAILDTGNVRSGVIIPERSATALRNRASATAAGTAHTVSNAIPMFAVKVAAPPSIGDTPLQVSEVEYPSVGPANVGSLALGGLSVRVDTMNRRVSIGPG
jgi:hypothetical protein